VNMNIWWACFIRRLGFKRKAVIMFDDVCSWNICPLGHAHDYLRLHDGYHLVVAILPDSEPFVIDGSLTILTIGEARAITKVKHG